MTNEKHAGEVISEAVGADPAPESASGLGKVGVGAWTAAWQLPYSRPTAALQLACCCSAERAAAGAAPAGVPRGAGRHGQDGAGLLASPRPRAAQPQRLAPRVRAAHGHPAARRQHLGEWSRVEPSGAHAKERSSGLRLNEF